MPALTILFGLALMAVGIGTFAGSGSEDYSALLPAVFGLIALVCGVGSIVKKELRKHFMHAAMGLAALGVLVPLIRLGIFLADMETKQQMQLIRVILTVAFSGAYVYVGVQSFRAARLARKDGRDDRDRTPPPPPTPTPEPEPTAEP